MNSLQRKILANKQLLKKTKHILMLILAWSIEILMDVFFFRDMAVEKVLINNLCTPTITFVIFLDFGLIFSINHIFIEKIIPRKILLTIELTMIGALYAVYSL